MKVPFPSSKKKNCRIDRNDPSALAPVPARRGPRGRAGPRAKPLRSADSTTPAPALDGMGGAMVVFALSGGEEEGGED